MALLERDRTNSIREKLKRGVNRAVRPYRPTLFVDDVGSIRWEDFDKGNGVHAVFDKDSTLTRLFGFDVFLKAKANIKSGRKKGVIRETSIGSNTVPRTEIDFVKVASTLDQIEGDRALVPLSRKGRKPNADMPTRAVAESKNKNATVVLVGDKLTSDIAAGNRAGVDVTIAVKKAGKGELVGDYARRLIEAGMKFWMKRVPDDFVDDNPSETPIQVLRRLQSDGTPITTKPSPDRSYSEKLPSELWENSKISGHGAPVVELPQEVLDAIPPRVNIPGRKEAKKLVKALTESKPGQYVGKIIYEDGGVISDIMSLTRIPDGIKALYFLGRKKPQLKKARIAHAKSMAKDLFDGPFARRSKRGATKEGAKKDLIGDRAISIGSEFGLVLAGRLLMRDFSARVLREVFMAQVRSYYGKMGIDTKANWVGKLSTDLQMPVDNLSMRDFAENNPKLNKKLQRVVTLAKLVSFLYSWNSYRRQVKFRKLDMPKYEEEVARLTQKIQEGN